MFEVADKSVDLIVTSPPYWHIKDYGVPGQIGYGQTLHEYLKSLYYVWFECFRVLREGGRLCINIGDQFARSIIYGKYKVIPLHAEFIIQCEKIGFDFMGSIIWQKKTTMNTTGGANVMGSFPYPPNGIVEIDYEFIHIFKKPGNSKRGMERIFFWTLAFWWCAAIRSRGNVSRRTSKKINKNVYFRWRYCFRSIFRKWDNPKSGFRIKS